jgi:hypothetical protein
MRIRATDPLFREFELLCALAKAGTIEGMSDWVSSCRHLLDKVEDPLQRFAWTYYLAIAMAEGSTMPSKAVYVLLTYEDEYAVSKQEAH